MHDVTINDNIRGRINIDAKGAHICKMPNFEGRLHLNHLLVQVN